jgi:hypothetical protein
MLPDRLLISVDSESRASEALEAEIIILENHIRRRMQSLLEMINRDVRAEKLRWSKYPTYKMCICGQIWALVFNDCGYDTCGHRIRGEDHLSINYYYDIKWKDESLSITKIDVDHSILHDPYDGHLVGLTKEEQKMNVERMAQGKMPIQPVGCGRYLNWDWMPNVTGIVNKFLGITDDDKIDLNVPTSYIVRKYINA